MLWGDMSQGGKEIMIKSVAQALATYKLPMSLYDELTKLDRDFWWGVEKGHRKVH
jgi:hypothetical protein